MTDIKVSECCGAALVPVEGGFTCRKCEGACDTIWEVIIWDDGKAE